MPPTGETFLLKLDNLTFLLAQSELQRDQITGVNILCRVYQ